MINIITILCVILVFGLIIFIHELGHFLTAKAFKVKVHEFALGMGPVIFKKQKGETQYSLRAIPMGGYVKMEGEDAESEDENAFNKKKGWQKLIILASGAIMNFILGFVVLIVFVGLNNNYAIKTTTIETVPTEYNSYVAGLRENDKIIEIDDNKIRTYLDISVNLDNKKEVDLTVLRNGEKLHFDVPMTEVDGAYYLGISVKEDNKNILSVIKHSYEMVFTVIKFTYQSFGDILTGEVGVNQMSGPVGIVTEIGNAAKSSIWDVLWLLILITLNLGIVNLFPLPALDGGRIIFVLYEMATRKKVKPQVEGIIHFIGFMLLILLMLYITKNDILKLFK